MYLSHDLASNSAVWPRLRKAIDGSSKSSALFCVVVVHSFVHLAGNSQERLVVTSCLSALFVLSCTLAKTTDRKRQCGEIVQGISLTL